MMDYTFQGWLKNNRPEIEVEEPPFWLKANPFTLKPVQIADIRPYKHEEKEETPLVEFKPTGLNGRLLADALDDCFKSVKRYRQDPALMDAAIYGKFATDKLEENEMERECRNCSNCKYSKLNTLEYPCKPCKLHDRWEPKEEKMPDYKMILSECEKMAKRYNLRMEGTGDPLHDTLKVKFINSNSIFIDDTKGFCIYGLSKKDPREVLEKMERELVSYFNIDLNNFEPVKVPAIKNVIFNDPATIIFWVDGSKTVVKAQDEKFDPEKGMAMAIAKKALGNQGNYCNVFKKWLPEEEVEKEMTFTDAMAAISEFAKHFNLGEVDFRLVPKEEENEITDKSI